MITDQLDNMSIEELESMIKDNPEEKTIVFYYLLRCSRDNRSPRIFITEEMYRDYKFRDYTSIQVSKIYTLLYKDPKTIYCKQLKSDGKTFGYLDYFSNLRDWQLNHGQISSVDWLFRLPSDILNSIQSINLSYNNLFSIPTLIKSVSFKNLHSIYLPYNRLTSLNFLQSFSAPNLRIVYLHCNSIQNIQYLFKYHPKNTVDIYLHDNQLKIPSEVIRSLRSQRIRVQI